MTTEIDYNELFGVQGDQAEAAGETDPQPETKGEEIPEQETGAAPSDEGSPSERHTEGKAAQSREENARYAAARREAEAQRDEAIQRARQEAAEETKRQIDDFVAKAGLVNPYTGQAIKTKDEFDAYKSSFGDEQRQNLMRKMGWNEEEFQKFLNEQPVVKEARTTLSSAKEAEKQAKDVTVKAEIDEDIKKIHELDPGISSLDDLAAQEGYDEIVSYVRRGYRLIDAFKALNFDRLMASAAAGGRQAAINGVSGKQHMGVTVSRGTGGVTVPEDVMKEYRFFNPDASEEEIRRHYAKHHQEQK